MSLLRDSAIVGVATFLVGSALMQFNITEDGKEVGWWPYLGTFISGALGFYLIAATDVVKVKNAEQALSRGEIMGQSSPGGHSIKGGHRYVECQFCQERKPLGHMRRMPYDPEQGKRVRYSGHHSTYAVCDECYRDGFRGHPVGKSVLHAEGPTDDELEAWSERQDDGSMLVTIDEDGDSHTELTYDEEGDLAELKRFMAEVFEATKPRRRTTLTWTRGIEPAYLDTNNMFKTPRPYDVGGYWYDNHYMDKNAYHIKELPDGYHLHLWKPRRRGEYWRVKMKSPHADKWVDMSFYRKTDALKEVVEWYNDQVAIPGIEKLTPIEQMLMRQGLVSGDMVIKIIKPTPTKTQWFYEGGPEKYPPTKFAELSQPNNPRSLEFFGTIPPALLNFCRGLIYIGPLTAGNVRNVNRYNADRKQWVKSKPSWFRNMVAQKVKSCSFEKDWRDWYSIEGIEFLKFYGSHGLNEKKYVKGVSVMTNAPAFQVHVEQEDGVFSWITPRPTTMMKMYDRFDPDAGIKIKTHIFNECVAKYQPQAFPTIEKRMLGGSIVDSPKGFDIYGAEKAGRLMLRRFKKN